MEEPNGLRYAMRKWGTGLLLFLWVTIVGSLIGQYAIEIANDKGLFSDAGKKWDAAVGVLTHPYFLGFALFVTGFVLGLWVDLVLAKKEPEGTDLSNDAEAEFASLTLRIAKDSDPEEIASENMESWTTQTYRLEVLGQENELRRAENWGWFGAVWFEMPIYNYQARLENLDGEPVRGNISWTSPKGLFFTISIPREGLVFRLVVKKRVNGRQDKAIASFNEPEQFARGAKAFPPTVTQSPAPNLTDEEKNAAKGALTAIMTLIDSDIAALQREARWLGSAPQKLTPRTNEIPALRDRARNLATRVKDLSDERHYGLHLAGVNLSFLADALNNLENGTQSTWSRLRALNGSTDQSQNTIVNEFKTPAVKANGELGAAIEHARSVIRSARNQLDQG